MEYMFALIKSTKKEPTHLKSVPLLDKTSQTTQNGRYLLCFLSDFAEKYLS